MSSTNSENAGQARSGRMRQAALHGQTQVTPTRDEQAAEHAQALDEVLDDIETSLQGNAA